MTAACPARDIAEGKPLRSGDALRGLSPKTGESGRGREKAIC